MLRHTLTRKEQAVCQQFQQDGKVYGHHDGRNKWVQEPIHSGKWRGLLSCMVEVLVVAAETVYGDKTTENVRVKIC